MIRSYGVRVWEFLWRFSFFRWGTFHGPAGALNYAVAFCLFFYFQVDMYIATLVGHYVHVGLGFFYDRDVTFKALRNRGWRAGMLYMFNDSLSLASILLTVYLLVDYYAVHTMLVEYFALTQDVLVAIVRAGPAMLIVSILSYGLNKLWTFNEGDNQHTLA